MALTTEEVAALVVHAAAIREQAHAPYSGFKVGAAAVDESQRVFFGCNVENASYGLSLCAERCALAAAVAGGAERIAAVVVVTEADPPATPCGACRQWMAEFGGPELEVVCAGVGGVVRRYTLAELLPESFAL